MSVLDLACLRLVIIPVVWPLFNCLSSLISHGHETGQIIRRWNHETLHIHQQCIFTRPIVTAIHTHTHTFHISPFGPYPQSTQVWNTGLSMFMKPNESCPAGLHT